MTDETDAGRIAGGGVVLFLAVNLGFVAVHEIGVLDAALLSALLTLLPALAVAQMPLVAGTDIERIPAYVGSGVSLVVIGGAALALGLLSGGPGRLGLAWPPASPFLPAFGAILAGAALVTLVFHLLGEGLGWEESPVLRALLPRTAREKTVFAGLSVVAGFGEELAYRGWVIPVLAPVLGGPWQAAVFSSLVFGVLHAYQGAVGIARTALLGMLFAASLVVTGTLWPAIAAHVVVDLVGGLVLGDRLTRAG